MGRRILHTYSTIAGQTVSVVQGDLTCERVDAIVNAANEQLSHGGGVAEAIVRRGGAAIQQESDRWVRDHGPVATGRAAITGAGTLPSRYVIHAVGPVWHGRGDEDALLTSAVHAALATASRHGLNSVALPAVSSGIFGFPKDRAARVILAAVDSFLADNPGGSVREVVVCNIDDLTCAAFLAEVGRRGACGRDTPA